MLSRLRSSFLLLSIVAAAGVCAQGCERRWGPAASQVTMRIGVGVPSQARPRSGMDFMIGAMSTEAWVTGQLDGRQTERLASSWEWNAAGTALTLRLRKNVYFHDGNLLTPEIAAESLRKSVAAREAFSFSSITGVTAKGRDSIEITLSAPNSFVLPDLALTPVRLPWKPEVGTGPFLRATTDAPVVLRAFDKYYRGRPAVDEIQIFPYPTQRNAWAALMRNEVDMLQEVSLDAVDFVEAETMVNTYSFPRSYYIPFVFNVRHPVLANVEVRRAINEAIDKDAVIRDGMRGRGRPADGPIWPDHWAYAAPKEPFRFNPEAARLRLDRAGFPVLPGHDGRMPARFAFTCLVFGDDSRFERLALLVQRQLAAVGIDMKLVAVPLAQLSPRLGKGDFDAFIFEMAGRSLSWVYEFWHSREGGFINTGYRAADTVLDRIRSSRSDAEVRAGIAELARTLHNDPPAAFLAWQEQSRAVAQKFDVAAEPQRDILSNVWMWRPSDRTQRQQASR